MIAAHEKASQAGTPDQLDWRIIAGLYVLALIPFGPLVVVVGSSVGYYWLRRSRPVSATKLNRHAFAAFALAVALVVARRVLHV
jgi:hypothetical protein